MSENPSQFSAGDALGKAQEYAEGHGDQVSGAIDKAQEAISNATGGKFDDAIEKGADMLEDKLGINNEQDQAQPQEQTGSAPQEGVEQADTAPPVEPTDPTQDPSDPSAPADPSVPNEPSIPSEPGTEPGAVPGGGTDQPTVQPSGEPGTTIPTEGGEPATEPGYGGGETGAEGGQEQQQL